MRQFAKNAVICLFLAASILLVSSPAARAQVVAHSVEAAGFVGGGNSNYTLDPPFTSPHPYFGGSGGYNVTKNVTALGEFKYESMGSHSSTDYKAQFFGGAARYNFLSSKKVVPYALLASGGYRFAMSQGSNGVSYYGYYIGTGGGVSYYLGKSWGVRPEMRYERQHISNIFGTGDFTVNSVVGSGAIFYQFGGKGKK